MELPGGELADAFGGGLARIEEGLLAEPEERFGGILFRCGITSLRRLHRNFSPLFARRQKMAEELRCLHDHWP